MIKNNKPLLIYGIIILVILVLILFVIPDDFFARKYQKNAEEIFGTEIKESEPEYVDFEEQKERLKKKNYTYSYQMLAYVKKDTQLMYSCKGAMLNGKEEGICTKPDAISYNEKNIKEKLEYVNLNYFEPEYIFNLVKDMEVEPVEYTGLRIYTYQTKISGVYTEIQIYTDRENIVQIDLSSAKETYVMKYSDITY